MKRIGSAVCWGWKATQELKAPAGEFITLSSGAAHACGMRTDGSVACWGNDSFGDTTLPGGRYLQLSARKHVCGVREDKSLRCWGENDRGQAAAGRLRDWTKVRP